MKQEMNVWLFDTVGSCVYGEAIVAARNKDEAIKTLIEFYKQDMYDIRNFSLEPVMIKELKASLIEPKVIIAWYDMC